MTTTTAINDISDLARILEERPEWAETLRSLLLTREILELPEKLAQLTERMDQFILELRETNARLDQFNLEQRETNARLDQVILEQQEIRRELRETNARLEEFVQEQREINRAQQRTNARVEQRLTGLEQNVEELNQTTSRMRGELGQLIGESAERRVHDRIDNIVRQRLELRRVTVLKSVTVRMERELDIRVDYATDDGRITREDARHLREVDIILSAFDREAQQDIYIAGEISRTVDLRDVERARARADILAKVTGRAVYGMVVGAHISPQYEEQAAQREVMAIAVAELDGRAAADAGSGDAGW